MELDNTHLEKASRRIHAWNSLLGEMNYVCCKKRVNKELKKRCVMTHQHLQMVGLFLWEWDIKVAWYWFLGTINMKPLHLSICCSAVCLPLKSVIMTPQLMAVCGCLYIFSVYVYKFTVGCRIVLKQLCYAFCVWVCTYLDVACCFIACVCLLQKLTGPVIVTGCRQLPRGRACWQQLVEKKNSCWWASSTKSPHWASPFISPSFFIYMFTYSFTNCLFEFH